MPNGFGVHAAEEVVVVAFAVHDVDCTPWLGEGFLGRKYSSDPSKGFTGRILPEVSLVGATSSRLRSRPCLRREKSQWIARRRHGKTRVEKESIPRAGVQSPKALALASELQRGRVMQDQHICVPATARRGHRRVRLQDLAEGHVIVVQEPVERLELSLRPHGLGKAPCGIESKPFADALSLALRRSSPSGAPRNSLPISEITGRKRSRSARARKELVWDP